MALIAQGLRRALGRRLVLDAVDAEIAAGTITGFVGPNGAGKSTLLRILAGIDTPDAGTVHLDGARVQSFTPSARARRIAHLPQVAQPQWPLSGRDVVTLGRLPHGAGFDRLSPADARAVDRAMARTGTAAFADRRLDQLSAGERARLMLARALATEADVLLVDEPTAALDPAYQIEAMTALRAEADRGVAVAVALHDLALAARFCDRLLLLAGGKALRFGAPSDVLTPAALKTAYGVTFALVAFEQHDLPIPVSRPTLAGSSDPSRAG
ncbi:ABC transporter ATP-binding protein [Reyranella sp. CPCC 100927]|uniref:ABC transporter ATP-binding protein n=1 Tax=Reyranella sp. CPCC 100927 TaxID=2599616 RepID=UPI0011B3CDEE|nr:ABC transporter ATP-binding protein [Reyranella sp. CPCC 100927]TWT03979.1 ABC transporter ATP-binding protein [Reyranella sp. CPCC 100927]